MEPRHSIDPTAGLSEPQRIARISELLSKAILLDTASRIAPSTPAESLPLPPPPAPPNPIAKAGPDAARIESYLALVGEASPSLIGETLGLPRMRIYRATQRLRDLGRLIVSGQTRSVTYRLDPSRVPPTGRN